MSDTKPTVIVRRVKKHGHAAHHGGSWKVAYADFVTAMMAFFLVLWLVASTSKPERGAISEYFRNPSPLSGKSTTPAFRSYFQTCARLKYSVALPAIGKFCLPMQMILKSQYYSHVN